MINVTIGTTMKRKSYPLTPDTTLKAALEGAKADVGIDYATSMMTLDGSSLAPGDLNKTFAELGYDGTPGHNTAFLISVVKADNAA